MNVPFEVPSWVQDYIQESNESEKRAIDRVVQEIDSFASFDPAVLIRTVYEDKFQFKDSIACDLFHSIPPKLLLAFYEQIVLPVVIEGTVKDFTKTNGLTPDEVIDLYERGRVLPIIVMENFVLIKDYMKPILQKRLPLLSRSWKFFDVLSERKSQDCKDRIDSLGRLEKTALGLDAGTTLGRAPVAEYYRMLCCLGFDDLADYIVEKYELSTTRIMLTPYWLHIVDPIFLGLGSSAQLTKYTESLLADMSTTLSSKFKDLPKIDFLGDSVFPVEVGQFLSNYYELTFPANPSLEMVDKIYRDRAMSKARKALLEFDNAVRQRKGEKAIALGKDLEEIFLKASEAIPALDKRFEKTKLALYSIATGTIGFVSLIQPVIGLLAGLGFKMCEKRVLDPLTRDLVGNRFNPLSSAIWRFEKEFRDVEHLKITREKIRSRASKPIDLRKTRS